MMRMMIMMKMMMRRRRRRKRRRSRRRRRRRRKRRRRRRSVRRRMARKATQLSITKWQRLAEKYSTVLDSIRLTVYCGEYFSIILQIPLHFAFVCILYI